MSLKSEKNVESLGQVYTPDHIVEEMISLIKNKGNILEPSAGNGAFTDKLKDRDVVAIEIDKRDAKKDFLVMDFFDYPTTNKFDTIIGNPPYVRYQSIEDSTKKKLKAYKEIFDKRTNLNLFFIYKSIEHLKDGGELIFIVPREFLKATSAAKLNKYIYSKGTITHLKELGDESIFEGANPNTVIFRFEKGNFTRKTNNNLNFKLVNGQLLFLSEEYPYYFNDLFFVKVGAVSGADKIFTHEDGNKEFVSSFTKSTGKLKKMYYNVKSPHLEKYKNELLKRKVKKFNEDTWYKWGRGFYESVDRRIYVNLKTRNKDPFFTNKCNNYDGSILAIFPKFKATESEINELITLLNNVNWLDLGFIVDGRYIFSQRSLEKTLLPKEFKKYIEKYKKKEE